MLDFYRRKIEYVRISVTDRCNLRCRYCMPADGVEKLSHADILSFEEIVRVVRALAQLGIRKVRLTSRSFSAASSISCARSRRSRASSASL